MIKNLNKYNDMIRMVEQMKYDLIFTYNEYKQLNNNMDTIYNIYFYYYNTITLCIYKYSTFNNDRIYNSNNHNNNSNINDNKHDNGGS